MEGHGVIKPRFLNTKLGGRSGGRVTYFHKIRNRISFGYNVEKKIVKTRNVPKVVIQKINKYLIKTAIEDLYVRNLKFISQSELCSNIYVLKWLKQKN